MSIFSGMDPIAKRYLLTSYKVDDVTKRAPRDNVTLMAQGANHDFILYFATSLMLQSCYSVYTNLNSQKEYTHEL